MVEYIIKIVVTNNKQNVIPYTKEGCTNKHVAKFYSFIQTFASFIPEGYSEISYKEDDNAFSYETVVEGHRNRFRIIFAWAHDPDSESKSCIFIDSSEYENIIDATQAFQIMMKGRLVS